MSSNSERGKETLAQVKEITVRRQYLTNVQPKRITSTDCLNGQFVHEQLIPNTVTQIYLAGVRWAVIAPVSSYSPNEHLMMVRLGREYTPAPERVNPREGEELMPVMASIAQIMNEDPRNRYVTWGYNWSPRSFGQQGYQSMPTIFHPSIFGLPDLPHPYIRMVDVGNLDLDEQRAVTGEDFTESIARLTQDHVLDGHFQGDHAVLNNLLDISAAEVSRRGIRIPLRNGLVETLRFPGLFRDLLQPVARSLDSITKDLSRAFTDLDPQDVDERVEDVAGDPSKSEEARLEALEFLTRTPFYLKFSERRRNIQEMAEKGYPPGFIDYLRSLNSTLPDSGPASDWKVGFGYSLALIYDTYTQEGSLAIFATRFNGPGGVVEGPLGSVLRRPPDPFSPEEMVTRAGAHRKLVA